MSWLEIDKRQRERGYNLTLTRKQGVWRAVYESIMGIAASAQGFDHEEVISLAAVRSGWEEDK